MKSAFIFFVTLVLSSCYNTDSYTPSSLSKTAKPISFVAGSWQDFLQHLPTTKGSVVDYQNRPVYNGDKAFELITYDVGTKDLQQCADALIRLRAEYLFSQHRYDDIRFHFTSGHLYAFDDYCDGFRPVVNGNKVSFAALAPTSAMDYKALRSYLDKELLPAKKLTVGTVFIKPGSPGHCSIIIDEATTPTGEKLYKLAEGFTPAQGIYVLRNPTDASLGPWQELHTGASIQTASYLFTNYQVKTFE